MMHFVRELCVGQICGTTDAVSFEHPETGERLNKFCTINESWKADDRHTRIEAMIAHRISCSMLPTPVTRTVMTTNDQDAAGLRARFLDAMSQTASSVCVVTTDGANGRAGVTVSSMSPVSADGPQPSLLVCLHHEVLARAAIQANGAFCVNLLAGDQHTVADHFAGRTAAPESDRFADVDWTLTPAGGLRIAGALVSFDCTLERSFLYGSHHILVGAVLDIERQRSGAALLYTNREYGLPGPLDPALD